MVKPSVNEHSQTEAWWCGLQPILGTLDARQEHNSIRDIFFNIINDIKGLSGNVVIGKQPTISYQPASTTPS